MGSRLLRLIGVFAVASFMFLQLSLAQKTTGDIHGTVTDQTGASIPGCELTLTDQATGSARKTTSDAQGDFTFLQLPVGNYTLTGAKQGFKTLSQKNVEVHVATVTTTALRLEVGAATETVTVEAAALTLNTENGEVGNVMLSDQVSQLPLNGRNFIELTTLMPGTAVGGGFDNKNKGLLAGVDISFSGAPANANQWQVNGANNNDQGSQRTILIYPSVDAIQEFKILRNSYGPEYGGAGGAQINLVTKSGGNQFHGNAYYYGRNDVLNAENFFLGQQKQNCIAGDPVCGKKNFLRRNDYGYTIGGPIKKDKLFFFGDYQGNHVIIGQSGNFGLVPVPTSAERTGDFSALGSSMTGVVQGPAWAQQLSDTLGYTVTQGEPYYFAGCDLGECVFPGAQIPSTAFTVPSQNLLEFIPPSNAGDGVFSPVAGPSRLRDDKASGRVDYNSRLGLLSGYYFFDQYRQHVPSALLPGFGSDFIGRSQVVNLGDSKTLSTSSVNELRFGFTRIRYLIHSPSGGAGVTPASLGFPEGPDTLGISPVNAYAHIPGIHFSTFSFGASGGPLGVTENTFQVMDNFSKVVGTHTLTFGGQFRYNQLVEYNVGSNGDFNFDGAETGIDFADFLIGAPTAFSQGQSYPSYGRARYFGLFAQDSWRARPNLTLNYGLRWDVSRPWSELHGELETMVPGLQSTRFPGSPTGWVFPGDPGIPSTLAPTRYNNFAPRFGLAYSPSTDSGLLGALTGGPGKTSIRAGWGKFYSTFEGATNFNEIGDAPFGNYYGSPVPPEFATPFVDRGTGFVEGQRFPAPLPTTNTVINWPNYLPIGTSPAFWHKNVLPYTEEYQLSVERQLGKATLLTASYVGTQGHHLLTSLEANPGDPALCLSVSQPSQIADGTVCGPNQENGVFYPVAGGTINGTRAPYGPNFTSDGYFITIGQSSYNSLQLSLRQRISRLEFLAGYTYGKSLDNGSGYGEQINPLDLGQKSLSSFDVRHNFVVSYDYQLPFDRLQAPSRLVKGWRLSGITRFSTGQPVTLFETDDRSLLGTASAGAISLPVDTPNFTPGSLKISDPRSGQPYFNVQLFSTEDLGTLGTARRRFFSGPGLNNWDMALLKDTLIKEGVNLEFRAELFNAFNHAQFGQPDGNVNNKQFDNEGHYVGSFGTIHTANPPRIMQLSLKLIF